MINLFLIGKKGLDAVSGLSKEHLVHINAVVIAKDSGVVNDYSSAIEAFAKANRLMYFFRTDADSDIISRARLNVAIGWRWLIPLDISLIIFHDSILPKYRGFNPLVSALINGDNEIGVTALLGAGEFDKGAIINQRIIKIQYPIKIEKAIDLLAEEYALLLEKVLTDFIGNSLEAKAQDESKATFSLWRDEEDYRINWNQSSVEIKRMIDAVGFPYKGASALMDNVMVRIFDAETVPDVSIVNRAAGKVLFRRDDGYIIVCGEGLLKIREFFNDNGEKLNTTKFRIRLK